MHELGLIIDVVEKVDRIAEEQNLKKIDKVVLQVGEAFSVVPQMMKECTGVPYRGPGWKAPHWRLKS